MPYGSKLYIPPTNYHLPVLAVEQEPNPKSQQKTSGEWTIHYTALAEKSHGRKSMMIRLKNKQTKTKNKNGDGNGDSNIGPEISDTNHRGETSNISGLHSAVRLEAMRTKE